jgi:hypothetical protein
LDREKDFACAFIGHQIVSLFKAKRADSTEQVSDPKGRNVAILAHRHWRQPKQTKALGLQIPRKRKQCVR